MTFGMHLSALSSCSGILPNQGLQISMSTGGWAGTVDRRKEQM